MIFFKYFQVSLKFKNQRLYMPLATSKFGNEKGAPRALMILCEVYRQARCLWPEGETHSVQYVTVRIDVIKDLSHEQIRSAHLFRNVGLGLCRLGKNKSGTIWKMNF